MWSVILCGSIVAACSGTIETPTEEFPARQGSNSAASTANANDDARPAPRPQAPAANDDDDRPAAPVASNDDDDPVDEPAADDEDPPADDPPAGGATLSFADDIQPILVQTCGPCHDGVSATAGVTIADSDVDAAFENAVDREDRVLARIDQGTMPPGCLGGAPGDPGCISEDDLADLEAWYEAGAPE